MATYKNINGDYVITTLNVDNEITLTSANIRVNGPLSVNGNVTTTGYLFGDGSFLTNVVSNVGAASKLQNGTSNVDIPVTNGNITFGVGGTGNIITITSTGQRINTGVDSTSTGSGALIITGGAGVSGNITAGNIYANNIFANSQPVLTAVSVINGGTY